MNLVKTVFHKTEGQALNRFRDKVDAFLYCDG